MSDRPTAAYAVKYAERDARRADHFHGGDPHDAPMPMDYYVWAVVSPGATVVVDTGFTAEVAAKRGRRHLREPADALRMVGVEAERVDHVVLSHFHYDHIGTLDRFPAATFWVQEAEMAFWTGRYAGRGQFRGHLEVDDLFLLIRANLEGRVRFVDGSADVIPGVTVHHVGGHTAGTQVTQVETARGRLVLASDASHFYANIEEDRPFSIVTDLPGMYRAFDRIKALADSPAHVVAGHDPLVMERFEPAAPELRGIAVRLA